MRTDSGDAKERAACPDAAVHQYAEFDFDYKNTAIRDGGFKQNAANISDNTDIQGYFQTEKYLDRDAVLGWYRFKDEKITNVRGRYGPIDFSNCVGLSVRLGDFVTHFNDRFYVPRREYYQRALGAVPHHRTIIVFSDDPQGAREHLGELGDATIYIEGREPFEQLYLQSLCRDFICSPSTFSWWGAWLIAHPDKVVIAPKEGPYRPGSPDINPDFWPAGWITADALRPIRDHHWMIKTKIFPRRVIRKLLRLASAYLA